MSIKKSILSNLFLEFHTQVKSRNSNRSQVAMAKFNEAIKVLSGSRSKTEDQARAFEGVPASKPVKRKKKNTATAGSTNKKPIVKSSSTKTVKPTSPKPKLSIWDRVKRKRKATGDVIADKVQKQREDREDKPKKKTITNPKKVRSAPFW